MFTTVFRLSVMSIALLAAFALAAHADEPKPGATEGPAANALQTYYPAPGSIDFERNNARAALGPIRADAAYALGITGKGVTIATMDTGISASHREFAEAGKILPGFNAIDGSPNVTDAVGHGTHVAGLIAAGRNGAGIFGVAFDARLLPIKVLADNGSGSTAYLDHGLRYAIGKAPIVNMSLGAANNYNPAAVQDAVRAGMLLVVAAGNDRLPNPGWPARFAKESWANNQIVAVGAVDANNRIASFSNRAGDTAAWFVVAPGVNIVSSYLDGQYAYMSGTSMATPIVSGAAALIKQRWPALAAAEIANILFLTATDLGEPGIDPVYGRGLINIEKAMQPIGTVTTTTYNGRTINVLSGATLLSSATSRLWQLASSGQLHVIGLDDFKRDFNLDLSSSLVRPAGLSLQQVFGAMDRRIEVAETVLANGASLAVAYERNLAAVDGAGGFGGNERAARARLAAFALQSSDLAGHEASVGMGGMAANYFGVGGLTMAQPALGTALAALPALANPYFSLVPGASHAGLGQQIGGVKLKLGMLSSGFNQTIGSQDVSLPTATSGLGMPRASAAVFELSKTLGDAAVSVSVSKTSEANAYLGSQSNGALGLAPNATTHALQFAAAVLVAPRVAVAGQAAYGMTPGGYGTSLVTEVTRARTNAFSVGLVAADSLKPGDRLSVTLAQPMRTYAGQVAVDTLTGMTADGTPTREHVLFSMVPLGRELRLELNYQALAGRHGSSGVTLMLRHDPNHLADAEMEKLAAWRYVQAF